MAKIDHPLFGYLAAFWIPGVSEPFYSLHEAKDYQRENGGDILNWTGKVIYPQPPKRESAKEKPAPEQVATSSVGFMQSGSSGNWFSRLFSRS